MILYLRKLSVLKIMHNITALVFEQRPFSFKRTKDATTPTSSIVSGV